MLDLKKLNDMLDSALESETRETLTRWIEAHPDSDNSSGSISANVISDPYIRHTGARTLPA